MRNYEGMLTIAMVLCILMPRVEAAAYSGGSGTESEPYTIGSAADWTTLSETSGDWDKHFILVGDIDFAGTDLNPVGYHSDRFLSPFSGVVEGDGHVLRNGRINWPSTEGVALFGYLDSGGEIRNLGVETMYFTGKDYVGGLVSINNGGRIVSCYSKATVTGDKYVGGLVAHNRGVIESCYATGTVTGGNYVGGLAGINSGMITTCYSTGAVMENKYTRCHSVGGLVGMNYLGTVMGSYWDMGSSGQGGSSGGKGLTSSQMGMAVYYQNAGWNAYPWSMMPGAPPRLEWEGFGWPAITGPDPVPLAGNGTEADPFQINSAADFASLSWYTEVLDKHIRLMEDLDLAGVTLYPIGDLGSFAGVFDGDGHVLRNCQLNQPESSGVGLFGFLDSNGVLQNLNVSALTVTGGRWVGGLVGFNNYGVVASCHATGAIAGNESVGGLVGNNYGAISSCNASGTVTAEGVEAGGLIGNLFYGTVTACHATSAVTGSSYVGGLAGYNFHGTITLCYATGVVTGRAILGGLVGSNSGGAVVSCYATGPVTGTDNYVGGLIGINNKGTIASSYATGAVSGTLDIGGLLGWNDAEDKVSSCYWDVDTSGLSASAGGEGRSTEEMTYPYAANVYAGWNFTEVWAEDVDYSMNKGYPYLAENVAPPAEGEGEGESVEGEPSITGAWTIGEDTEIVYNFCPDGTFTQLRVYYWGKCEPPEICVEKIGCGTYVTGEDENSQTIDLHYALNEPCVALGRFAWNADIHMPLSLNISSCGESRPDTPDYYLMRPSAVIDCVCMSEGELITEGEGESLEGEAPMEGEFIEGEIQNEGEVPVEGEPAEGEIQNEGEVPVEGEPAEGEIQNEGEVPVEGEPAEGEIQNEGEDEGEPRPCGCCPAEDKNHLKKELIERIFGDWLLVGVSFTALFALTTPGR